MSIVDIAGVPVKHDLYPDTLADVLKLIAASRAKTKLWTRKLCAAIRSHDENGQIYAREWLLKSPEALLTSAVAANRKLKSGDRQSLECCLDVPNLLDFSRPLGEIVRVRPKPKKPIGFGGPVAYRMLHNHGLLHRSAQSAVARVMGAYFTPRFFQFTHLGIQAAVARAKALIEAGYVYAAHLDIVDFYRNFSADALITELPLSLGVVEHAVVGRHMKVVMDQGRRSTIAPKLAPHTHAHLLLQARQGIPIGSASSPIIGMFCISHLAWPSMPDAVLLNYADDFHLFALGTSAVDRSIDKLADAVSGLPGGHFKLKIKASGCAAAGINFLGHRLQLINGKLKTAPTQANLEYFYAKLDALDTKFGKLTCWPGKIDPTAALKCAAAQCALIKGWMSAFSGCDDLTTRWAGFPLAKLAETLQMIGVSMNQVEESIEPWMGYEPGDTHSACEP